MIQAADLALAGKVNKTHGVKGELSVSILIDAVYDSLDKGDCLIMDIDGIFTPFFVASARTRGAESLLVALDDVDSQQAAAAYAGKDVYVLASSIATEHGNEDEAEDGFYAGQLIGFQACLADGSAIGTIADIDDSTDNVLFIVETSNGGVEYIPVVDEFIDSISAADRRIVFDLPDGLLQGE